jgi:hypothetical protein
MVAISSNPLVTSLYSLEAVSDNDLARERPQGLKPSDLCDVCGTTKVMPFFKAVDETGSSLVSLKFIEEQPQILRLTTPELKDVRAPFAQNDSQFCVAYFRFRRLEAVS